jgi:hypothetical protein
VQEGQPQTGLVLTSFVELAARYCEQPSHLLDKHFIYKLGNHGDSGLSVLLSFLSVIFGYSDIILVVVTAASGPIHFKTGGQSVSPSWRRASSGMWQVSLSSTELI